MKNLLLGTALSVATAFTALPAFAQPGAPGAPGRDGDAPGQVERGRQGRGDQVRGDHGRGRGPRHGHRNPERRLERMAQELDLSARQVEQLRAIFRETREAHMNLPRGPEQREAHRAIRERTKERVEAVLTPAQRTRFEELRAERRERFEERGGHGHHGGHGHQGRGHHGGRGHGDCPRGEAG